MSFFILKKREGIEMEKEKKKEKSSTGKVDRYRTDKRTGAISPVKPSRYVQYAYDELERQIPKE
ncbi:hypothetical protein ACIGC1_27260 [Peribacillus butanolivorans]|uniref:hypothetical protein n=1 Tax=Peribacillus butanolivorans TaxID=421767 RepID=UPI0037CAA6E6